MKSTRQTLGAMGDTLIRVLPAPLILGFQVLTLSSCVTASAMENQHKSDSSGSSIETIQVQLLSRGRGVPAESMQAYENIKSHLDRLQGEESGIAVKESVIGLEGERQLCVSSTDPSQIDDLYKELSELGGQFDLLRISKSDCDPAPDS